MRSILPVLVADDDAGMRIMLQHFLQQWGYTPRMCADGEEAWRMLQQPDAPRLAVLDWMMPVMNGREFLDIVSEHEEYKQIPMLVVTGFAGLDKSLPDDYLAKPVDTAALIAAINAKC